LARLCSTPELRPLPWVRRGILLPASRCKRKMDKIAKNLRTGDGRPIDLRSTHMIRHSRDISAACVLTWAWIFPLPAQAHDGPHRPATMVLVEKAMRAGQPVGLKCTQIAVSGAKYLQWRVDSNETLPCGIGVAIRIRKGTAAHQIEVSAIWPPELPVLKPGFGVTSLRMASTGPATIQLKK